MAASGIPYCDFSWNSFSGCTPDFQCYRFCWARKMSLRLHGRAGYNNKNPFKPTFHHDKLHKLPKKPSVIAACFMGDLFCDYVTEKKTVWQKEIFDTALAYKQHTFLFLTKRPENMNTFLSQKYCDHTPEEFKHIWIGTSLFTSHASGRAARLSASVFNPCRNLYLSLEPALERIKIEMHILQRFRVVIIGCESGPHPAPLHMDDARAMVRMCRDAGVPVYVKQLTVNGKANTNPNDWSPELRIQELPWRNKSIPIAGAS